MRPLIAILLLSSLVITGCSDSDSDNDNTAPELGNIYPDDDHGVQSRQVWVSGDVSDEAIASVVIESGDDSVEADIDEGQFSATINATPGNNSYRIIATDQSGNETSYDASFYFGARVTAGGSHTGAIVDGATYIWGRSNKGQTGLGAITTLADNPDTHPDSPVLLGTSTPFVSLAFNQNASIALDSSGAVWAWGDGDDGQLGLGTAGSGMLDEEDRLVPTQITGLSGMVAVVRGYDHSMALSNSGAVWAWGDNSVGQIGDGTEEDRDIPVMISGLSDIVMISAGSKSSYALDSQGNLWAWGRNSYGNLGQGTEDSDAHSSPVQVPLPEVIVSIATGRDHVLALARSGKVYAWGLNASSQVGLHESEQWEGEIHSPLELPWFDDAVAVYANGNQSFVERSDGKIYPWGQNGMGTLGIEVDGNVEQPGSAIFGLENVADLGVGAMHTIALREDGNIFTWGWSFEGSLGGGESTIHRWTYRVPLLIELPE